MPSSAHAVIETRELRKVFGSQVAVRGLSLTVPRGEIFGFLGPNGAGKSTSVKMLLGLVRPTGGHALVLGSPPEDPQVRRHVGFLPEDFRFYDWLSARELLELHGRLCGMSASRLRQRIPEILELVGLTPHRDRRLRGFSKGMLQRIGLAQAIIHEPQVVFLDEPTSGLDPMGRRTVRDILRAERERGATVFLNSHFLSEVEVTCDRVAFIKHGEVVAAHELGPETANDVRVSVRARSLGEEVVSGLGRWARDVRPTAEGLSLAVPSEEVLPDVVRHLVAAGADIYGLARQKTSLEELFVDIMGEDPGL
ncbi:MAG: ABC transporter ATP-binding protein [Gemmatimonadetes bacterium]|nr:ABC transporter ATP-binding protein [Gemmatimonadota bacterium]